MKESAFGGNIPHESKDFVADELPEIQYSSVDKQAITERILDQVISAAENNSPVERSYELSHERKDQDTQDYGGQAPMQSVGDIIGSSQPQFSQTQQSVDPSVVQSTPTVQSQTPVSHSQIPNLSYRQAVRYGVLTAVVVAVLFFVITM